MRSWKDTGNDVGYYYDLDNGLIVGQVHQIAHTKIWLAKVYIDYTDEKYLGQYVSHDFARGAVERFWGIRERTLEHMEAS